MWKGEENPTTCLYRRDHEVGDYVGQYVDEWKNSFITDSVLINMAQFNLTQIHVKKKKF